MQIFCSSMRRNAKIEESSEKWTYCSETMTSNRFMDNAFCHPTCYHISFEMMFLNLC